MVNRTITESILDCYNWCLDSLKPLFKKSFPCTRYTRHTGEEEGQLYQYLTSVPATLPPGKRAGPHWIGGWVDLRVTLVVLGTRKCRIYIMSNYMGRRLWIMSRWGLKKIIISGHSRALIKETWKLRSREPAQDSNRVPRGQKWRTPLAQAS